MTSTSSRSRRAHRELHRSERTGWLRAAVLGADDGILSTASLMIGVAASAATRSTILVAGLAGLVAGALSMAAGEYVSVSSQRDSERADIDKERKELIEDPEVELVELTNIYRERGLEYGLAREVARQLTVKDALSTHLRDELGLSVSSLANPFQAALTSAAAFAVGATLPVLALAVAPASIRIPAVVIATLVALAVLGAVGGAAGGAGGGVVRRASARVVAGGIMAMAITAVIGKLVGAAL